MCGLSRHMFSSLPVFAIVKLVCADDAVGRGLLMRESQRALFVNM